MFVCCSFLFVLGFSWMCVAWYVSLLVVGCWCLFVVHCLLFISLLRSCYYLCVVCGCLLCVVCYSLFVVCCLVFVSCCSFLDVCCLFGVFIVCFFVLSIA